MREFHWEAYKKSRRAKALASIAKDDLGINISKMLKKAEQVREIPFSEGPEKRVLMERLQLLPENSNFNILWVEDKTRREQKAKKNELTLIESFAGPVEWVSHDEDVIYELESADVEYDLIISDIRRRGNAKAGLELFSKLRDLKANGAITNLPPVVFYVSNLEPALGVPPYAFGITNSPIDLIHLVSDVYQRSGEGICPNSIAEPQLKLTKQSINGRARKQLSKLA